MAIKRFEQYLMDDDLVVTSKEDKQKVRNLIKGMPDEELFVQMLDLGEEQEWTIPQCNVHNVNKYQDKFTWRCRRCESEARKLREAKKKALTARVPVNVDET